MKQILKYISLSISVITLLLGCEEGPDFKEYIYPAQSTSGFSPEVGYPGQEVTFTGTNYDTLTGSVKVWFGGVLATDVVSNNGTEIVVKVPEGAVSGKVDIQVWTTRTDSVGNFTVFPLPEIDEVVSSSVFGTNIVFPGDIVNITGSGFGTLDVSTLSATIGGVTAQVLTPISDDTVKIKAPDVFPTGNVELTIVEGVILTGEPAMINPTAGGDITPYFLSNTGDTVGGGLFVHNEDALASSRWGTQAEPWITNDAAKNKTNPESVRVGGWAHENWGAPEGYLCFETWGNTPITDGKIYQQTGLELPAGDYTLSFDYYSEVTTNSTVHAVVAAGNGLPSLPDLSSAIASAETWNSTPIGATSPNVREVLEVDFTLATAQKVSLGFLVNMQGASENAGYFKVYWMRLIKN